MTANRTILDKDTIPRVEIDFMNNTHFEEVELVKELGQLILSYQKTDTHSDEEISLISRSLNVWLEHTKTHFDRENELMKLTQFPAYPIHSNEHQIALERMSSYVKAWEIDENIDHIADYVFTQWPAWFNEHVNTMDMMTAKFAVMNGFNEELLEEQLKAS